MSKNGSLTEAQRLLLQKFPDLPEDDPLVELAAWNASLEQKVDNFGSRLDLWTNAILKQTDLAIQQNQLIVSQNLTLQETAKNNTALGQTLLQFKQGLTQLQTEFKSLKGSIETHGISFTSLNEKSQNLSRKLDDLALKLLPLEKLTRLSSKVEEQSDSIEKLREGLSVNRVGFGFLLASMLICQVMTLFTYGRSLSSLQSSLQSVEERMSWALAKLERLEKR